jgi:hypothetical protein
VSETVADGRLHRIADIKLLCVQRMGDIVASASNNAVDEDVEECMSAYNLLRPTDPLQFSCTRCGECCRSSDHILLSPVDFFNLSRAANMHDLFGINNTTKLVSHIRFKDAFHFVLKEGLPICYLRPVKSAVGRCYFSYELTATRAPSCGIQNDSNESGVDLQTGDEGVHEEYQYADAEKSLTMYGGANSGVSADQVKPVYNSYGRRALGCLLGMSHMPTMCASYPIAPELNLADFWHVRRSFWRPGHPGTSDAGVGSMNNMQHKLATGWQLEERFVSVGTSLCEGFPKLADRADDVVQTPVDCDGRPIVIRSAPSKSAVPASVLSHRPEFTTSRTARDFLASSETNVSDKMEMTQWFLGLLEDVSSFLPARIDQFHGCQAALDKYVSILAKIWYNFDAVTKPSRPIKSTSRLLRDIETLTWSVVRATRKFLDDSAIEVGAVSSPVNGGSISTGYESLLRGLLGEQLEPLVSGGGDYLEKSSVADSDDEQNR